MNSSPITHLQNFSAKKISKEIIGGDCVGPEPFGGHSNMVGYYKEAPSTLSNMSRWVRDLASMLKCR